MKPRNAAFRLPLCRLKPALCDLQRQAPPFHSLLRERRVQFDRALPASRGPSRLIPRLNNKLVVYIAPGLVANRLASLM